MCLLPATRRRQLGGYQVVGFGMVLTPLRMSQDYELGPGIRNHRVERREHDLLGEYDRVGLGPAPHPNPQRTRPPREFRDAGSAR